jgi:hypothetical protein
MCERMLYVVLDWQRLQRQLASTAISMSYMLQLR